MFQKFARWASVVFGSSAVFFFAVIVIFIWLATGHYFNYSDTWELVINTITTIITFLMVFLIQNTQNRDTVAIHLKLDELIRANKWTHNELLKVEELSDEELKKLQKKYERLSQEVRNKINQGEKDTGRPNV